MSFIFILINIWEIKEKILSSPQERWLGGGNGRRTTRSDDPYKNDNTEWVAVNTNKVQVLNQRGPQHKNGLSPLRV
jgi:hypothetical protein